MNLKNNNTPLSQRKIIHVDMDCFYAAIEMRDNPALVDQAVAVGGTAEKRGVICTCNYMARKYGVHSAMPTRTALRLCPSLILLPVNMPKYKSVAKSIHAIFREFTDIVEPLALDEAYLDVTDAIHHQGSATLIAQAIRQRIWEQEQLTASAGVASNKLLAKIAGGWKKPNGLFVIKPNEVAHFMQELSIEVLFGVGKVTAEKLKKMGVHTCTDLQRFSLVELTQRFGKFGAQLFDQCRGIDHREVKPNRERKSLSVERTFAEDLQDIAAAKAYIHNFRQTTAEAMIKAPCLATFLKLFESAYQKTPLPMRLLGLGVHFQPQVTTRLTQQQKLEFS